MSRDRERNEERGRGREGKRKRGRGRERVSSEHEAQAPMTLRIPCSSSESLGRSISSTIFLQFGRTACNSITNHTITHSKKEQTSQAVRSGGR
eukprot:6199266-Pleurochrysis_carterae.AAC.8